MLDYRIKTIGDLRNAGLKPIPYNEMRENVLRAETAAMFRQYKDDTKVLRWSEKTHYTTRTLAEFLGVREQAARDYLTLPKNKGKVRRIQYSPKGYYFTYVIPKRYVVDKETFDDYVDNYLQLAGIFNISRHIIANLGLTPKSDGVSNRKYYSIKECEMLLKKRAEKKGN